MKKLAAILLMSASLGLPAISFAADQRYYDRDSRDYHVWNRDENRAYRHWWMNERHEHRFRNYQRLRAEQQREYWRWRHAHPDWH